MDHIMEMWLEDLKELEATRHENGSVSVYHPKGAYYVVARVARARAEEDFNKRAGERWRENQEAIKKHRDYRLDMFVVNT